MDKAQLTRLFECLLTKMPAPELFGMLDYSVRGPQMNPQKAPRFTQTLAELLVTEVEKLSAPPGLQPSLLESEKPHG